ncbi:McrC family protein [Actinomadura scrupuli]|uniref:McrC family protein n=1 Tax=Actinomadura scrupuli TaxID=559629 RepID=UPI003D97B328
MTTVDAADGLVILNEYESVKVTGLHPSSADIDAAESEALAKRITLRWLRGDTLEITANSHVGVVNLNCVAIHVRPKLAGRELSVLQMLDYASGLPALRNLDQLQRLGQGLHLRDLVCLLLARETDKLLRHGLRRDYLRREESLPAVRGRLLIDRQILRRYGQLDRLECRYDELSSDIPDNQLCGAALQVAARSTGDPTVRASARRLAADFADVCVPDRLNIRATEERLTYHRGNEHYRNAHRWALLLLRGAAFSDLYSATGPSSQAFMIDMNVLFEKFVTQLLRDATRGSGIAVRDQDSLDKAICHQDGHSYTTITPDIQLVHGHGPGAWRCSIDAKYKLYTDNKVKPGDLYQSFTYAQALSNQNSPRPPTAYILYASEQDVSPRTVILHRRNREPAARITLIAINVPHALETLASQNRQPMLDNLSSQILSSRLTTSKSAVG